MGSRESRVGLIQRGQTPRFVGSVFELVGLFFKTGMVSTLTNQIAA